MPAPLAIPAVIGGAAWLYRSYKAYKAYKKLKQLKQLKDAADAARKLKPLPKPPPVKPPAPKSPPAAAKNARRFGDRKKCKQKCPSKDKCKYCGRKKHDTFYERDMAERRKALLRDASDPSSELDPVARQFIKDTGGKSVPENYEVSHEKPLYTKPYSERCKLDKAWNMKTQPKPVHRARHKKCGDQYHDFGPPPRSKGK
ncbi:MAG TPA: hypothetical protein VFZ09_38330 [Archangium sp.]|uniref:hypothetical protein n=1 Tax=Archangium sp. TaxID=1872627 RepID=UPI002E342545|nr:hypothetical protein [Archangium sp.]HEX5752137.1 hypothetical protein [Archangium sp.]